MESNNIRTMELIGEDNLGNDVYKCIETGTLYKNVGMEGHKPELYSCGNAFDGDPSFPINSNFEIRFKETVKQISKEQKFNYMMLDRLKSDCEFYLGYGNRQVSRLWADSEQEHISKMKELYNGFSDEEKPEWLTYEQILKYEKLMINSK